MIVLAFFSWWYGRGWRDAAARFTKRIDKVGRAFSINLLLQTLFSPWRRIISYPGAALADHLRASLDNLVSRAIGFVVRLGVLLAACVFLSVIAITSIVELVIWPLLPPAIIVCVVLGIAT